MDPEQQHLSPIFSIWTRPRQTIRRIVDTDPRRHVLDLVILNGLLAGFVLALGQGWLRSWPWYQVALVCVIAGPLVGVASLYLGGALLRWTGKLLGGTATAEQVRTATAWSTIPTMAYAVLTIPLQWSTSTGLMNSLASTMPGVVAVLGYGAVLIGVGVWGSIITCKCLGEVHGFSAWRGWAATMIAGLMVSVPAMCIVFAWVFFAIMAP